MGIVSVAGILGIIILAPQAFHTITAYGSRSTAIHTETYQAVFLNNNQIYFGHMEISKTFYRLRDVYYVQIENGTNSQGRLVKLGEQETHRPENEMIINPEQVLFWENLKPDSPVVKTILNLKLQGK